LGLAGLLASCTSQEAPGPSGAAPDSLAAATAFADPPQWASQVVWYQIFVERFRNGDPGNDPRPEDLAGSYPGFVPEGWAVTP